MLEYGDLNLSTMINCILINLVFSFLLDFTQIAEILGVLLIPNLPSSPPDVEALRLYLLLIESPVFTDPSPERYGTLVVQFAEALCSLKTAGANVICKI